MEDFLEVDLKMTALGILYYTRWQSRKRNKPNSFVIKESLANFTTCLEDDDIGYLYDPNREDSICMDPGELCGRIANSSLPFNFNFYEGIRRFVDVLNDINEDYNRVGVIILDCLETLELQIIFDRLLTLESDVNLFLYCIGKSNDRLEKMCQGIGAHCVFLQDVDDFSEKLEDLRKSLTIVR